MGEDLTGLLDVKIPARRSVVAREVYFQSPDAKGRPFLDVDDVCWLFLASIRVCFSFEFLDLLVFSLALCLKSLYPLLLLVCAVSIL
ncbi:hypothetical protein N665_0606s0018 [Sinapis alba]|nr:hypothetical protein N665_0606s0018 [Sinapis alba]